MANLLDFWCHGTTATVVYKRISTTATVVYKRIYTLIVRKLTAQNLSYIVRSGDLAYNINMFQYLKIMRHAFITQAKFIVRGLRQIEICTLNVIVTPGRGVVVPGEVVPMALNIEEES